LWRNILLVVVVLEGQVFVFAVVCLVVFVVGIVQLNKIHDADIFLVAGDVVDKMMEKRADFEEGMHSIIVRRTCRQNLKSKKQGQVFFHCKGKDSCLWVLFILYFLAQVVYVFFAAVRGYLKKYYQSIATSK
jgi:hypothetical protein